MDVLTLKLDTRTVTGKKVKQLRRTGYVPVHMYGSGVEPSFHQVEAQVLRRVLPQVGTNVPLSVEIDGGKGENVCFVREVQRHPVSEEVLHVDFLRVDVSQTIQSEVPVILTGTAPAVPFMGGTLMQPLQTVLVESLPMNVPASFEVDVSELDDFEKAVYVRDITIGAGVTLLTDTEDLIARVSAPRVLEAVAVEAKEDEAAAEEEEAGE
ncbi:MAG: 50S ribosomal protein L25 [Chloroflexi bacterium]|nr:50S ribosomal protein L25 [Chloroflexota bacterium]